MKDSCGTCRHFAPLSPGHAAICYERWRDLPWNAAVPLTTADEWCEKHKRKGPQMEHASDCAVHNAPALEPRPCDCGGRPSARQCACPRDDAVDCAQARHGNTDEACECVCHDATTCHHCNEDNDPEGGCACGAAGDPP